jgi:hypothetical protein
MAENKTKPTGSSVAEYIASRANAEQGHDCARLAALLKKVTKSEPKMWGPSIVGYGSYRYKYDSGREGESCLTGFAIRKSELVVYLTAESADQAALLAKLGKHKMGKSCLYFKRLADLDTSVLEKLVASSVAEVKRRHAQRRSAA